MLVDATAPSSLHVHWERGLRGLGRGGTVLGSRGSSSGLHSYTQESRWTKLENVTEGLSTCSLYVAGCVVVPWCWGPS